MNVRFVKCVSWGMIVGMLTGCGTLQESSTSDPTGPTTSPSTAHVTSVSAVQNTKLPVVPEKPVAMKDLPKSITGHLLPYAKRLQHVESLPVKVPNNVTNVVVLSGVTAYAIPQFQRVWPKLNPKPAVVWVGLSEAETQVLWKQAGYHGDPLPSAVTLYENVQLPVPVAFHRVKEGWEELPGILPDNEEEDWLAFFKGVSP